MSPVVLAGSNVVQIRELTESVTCSQKMHECAQMFCYCHKNQQFIVLHFRVLVGTHTSSRRNPLNFKNSNMNLANARISVAVSDDAIFKSEYLYGKSLSARTALTLN